LSVTFLITASLLVSTAFARPATTDLSTMRPWQALVIGLAQGIAITPGISRSGTTIAVALLLGLKREDAARFSFLLSIPAILGALVLKADEASIGDLGFAAVGAGFLTSMVTGIFALTFLVGIVKRGGFPWFAPWCVLASATAAWVAWG
jgi:undecaprenyl-diphosphatase